ncbi:MAG TPA: pyridoxal-phosphate dependent enzyme [candidate division Zixibacteria bacterium]|nr:pyridoxal-phosphate dependent enzyme [candidate division Zixibacteria bacterium]
MVSVTPEAIRAARERIPAAFRDMPQFVVEPLSELLGVPVVVKAETANPIGCFKGRGTWLAVAALAAAGEVGEGSGLVVASAGNFGQGVAYTARARGVPLVVFAARSANPAKLAAMRRLGAEVRLAGEDFDGARAAAVEHADATGWRLLVDGRDPLITVGAGTIAVELTEGLAAGDLPPLTAVCVPVGNGALAGGIGRWLHAEAPGVRVVGVSAERAPAMALSWRERRPVETERADTVADGIAVRVPVPEALEVMFDAVDDVVLVGEEAILDAQRELEAVLPFTVEPSAAAAWAGVTAGPRPDGAIAFVLTGGNTNRSE